MSNFHKLTISEVKKITPTAVSVSFQIPTELENIFKYKPGQYVTLKHHINGKEVRRAYSICSSANSNKLSVGIKQVPDGTFSVFANTKLSAGDELEVMPPEGFFTLNTHLEHANHYLAFAAGSGITPILSIITTALEDEPNSTFSLAYGNRSEEEAMFKNDIDLLKDRYPERFFLQYLFSRKEEKNSLFGRIDVATVNYLMKNRFAERSYSDVFLCGPEAMIETVSQVLQKRGIAKDDIKFELFTTSEEGSLEESHDGMTQVTVLLDDETETFKMSQKSSVLEAALSHGIDAPFSCQGGICSTCIARITEGRAEMRKNQILTDEEIAEGLILTCQAHPSTPTLQVDYDDV